MSLFIATFNFLNFVPRRDQSTGAILCIQQSTILVCDLKVHVWDLYTATQNMMARQFLMTIPSKSEDGPDCPMLAFTSLLSSETFSFAIIVAAVVLVRTHPYTCVQK